MTKIDFKVWLAVNGYTQKSLAKRLKITPKTITNYSTSGVFPQVFILALKGLENEN